MNERIVGVLSLVLVTAACGEVINPGGGGDDGSDGGVDVDAASAAVDSVSAHIDAPPIDAVPALDCSTIIPPAGFTRENVDGFSQLFNCYGARLMMENASA